MKLGRITNTMLLLGVLAGASVTAWAEEITLKDGQKIVGTIVGYEKDMFRVQTSYGIALVRKDKVASIEVSKPQESKAAGAAPKPAPAKGTNPAGVATPPPAPHASSAATSANAHQPPEGTPPGTAAAQTSPAAPPAPSAATTPNTHHNSPIPNPPPPPVSHPLDVPMPPHLQEHVEGNTYFSDTFHFSMYKPPDWKIFEGVTKETGSGITAIGTEDEQTLLIVDRQVWSGTPKLTSDQVEAKLRQTYQDYRRISEGSFDCDGQPATRRTFTGLLDGAEWHGVAVHVIHGNMVFGIIGLTSAETFQFQEAIFNKIVRTFHFLTPAEGAASALAAPSAP